MLDHCVYDKIKIIKDLSSLVWFIKKHALHDAQNCGDQAACERFEALVADLEKHIRELYGAL